MSKAKDKSAATNPKALDLRGTIGQTEAQVIAAAALAPAINAASVVDAYQNDILGNGADLNALVAGLKQTTDKANAGDLSSLEGMLIGQATALQTIFTSLAKRAVVQTHQMHFESFLGLALKAQAQSRATISALVDLKYPRQATFVKQANISHGPQQVNNGTAVEQPTHARETQPQQNELFEDQRHGSTHLDTGATAKAKRSHTTVEAVEAVHWAAKPGG
jgi:hypothetical protein